MAAEAPCKVTSELDLDEMEFVMAARLPAAEDRTWVLREDPGFLYERLMGYKVHRQETLKNTRG